MPLDGPEPYTIHTDPGDKDALIDDYIEKHKAHGCTHVHRYPDGAACSDCLTGVSFARFDFWRAKQNLEEDLKP